MEPSQTKSSNEEVRRSEAALRAVLEGLPDAVIATREDGTIAFINAQVEELFGYRREELLDAPVAVLWPESYRDRYTRNMRLYFESRLGLRFTREAYGLHKDGHEFVGEMSWGIVETEAGPLMLAVGRDVSERLATEARLRRRSAEHAIVASLGERALSGAPVPELIRRAVAEVGSTLEADRAQLFELTEHGEELLRTAVWPEADPASQRITIGSGSHPESALYTHRAVALTQPGRERSQRSCGRDPHGSGVFWHLDCRRGES